MRVTLNLDDNQGELQYQIGDINSAKVVEISKTKKNMRIEFPNKETAHLSFSHLSDFPHGERLATAFPVGSTINNVLILDNYK
jgi:hypothetical protein